MPWRRARSRHLDLAGLDALAEGALAERLGDGLLAGLTHAQPLGRLAQDAVATAPGALTVLAGQSFGTGQDGLLEFFYLIHDRSSDWRVALPNRALSRCATSLERRGEVPSAGIAITTMRPPSRRTR